MAQTSRCVQILRKARGSRLEGGHRGSRLEGGHRGSRLEGGHRGRGYLPGLDWCRGRHLVGGRCQIGRGDDVWDPPVPDRGGGGSRHWKHGRSSRKGRGRQRGNCSVRISLSSERNRNGCEPTGREEAVTTEELQSSPTVSCCHCCFMIVCSSVTRLAVTTGKERPGAIIVLCCAVLTASSVRGST